MLITLESLAGVLLLTRNGCSCTALEAEALTRAADLLISAHRAMNPLHGPALTATELSASDGARKED